MIVWMVCAGSAGALIAVRSTRRLKTMSEKPGKLNAGRAGVLAVVAAGALVAACDVPLPTEPGDAIEETSAVDARESRDGSPVDATGRFHVVKWFASEPAPLVFVDGVRVGRYEDLPEPVRRWSESGLREEGLIDRVEVMHDAAARAVWGEEGAGGAIRIFMTDQPMEGSNLEPRGAGPTEPNRDNLRGDKFSGMAGPQPPPLVMIDGVRVDLPFDSDGFITDFFKAREIWSMQVIKGRLAPALFGEGAARGAILILTNNAYHAGSRINMWIEPRLRRLHRDGHEIFAGATEPTPPGDVSQ